MLYREIIAVYSEIYTERTNTLCGRLSAQGRRDFGVKDGGTYPSHLASVKGLIVAVIIQEAYQNVAFFPVCSQGTHCCREGCQER